MKKLLTFLSLALVALSCGSPNDIPEDIMGINEMKPVVWDMLRAGALAELQYPRDTAAQRKEKLKQYNNVFLVHHLTKDQFYHSYGYYMSHPDKNKILMDSVNNYAERTRYSRREYLKGKE